MIMNAHINGHSCGIPGGATSSVLILRTYVYSCNLASMGAKPLVSVNGGNSFRNRFNDITPLSAPAAATAGRSRVKPECTPTSACY